MLISLRLMSCMRKLGWRKNAGLGDEGQLTWPALPTYPRNMQPKTQGDMHEGSMFGGGDHNGGGDLLRRF
jgi:hypothetical protein